MKTVLSIGIFTYSTRPRGSVVHAMSLAEALVAAGHDATLYALAKPGAGPYRRPACPVELLPAEAAPSDPDALIRQRIEELAQGFGKLGRHHDILHAQDCLAANALLLSARRSPVVRTVHHVERFESPYLAQCQQRSICDADALLSVSRVTQDHVRRDFGRRSFLVHNGVDTQRFAIGDPRASADLRARFGILPGEVIVLSVGGVEPRKNTVLALRAFARAGAARAMRWIIAGDHSIWDHTAYETQFERELAALAPSLRERVVRAGTLSEPEMTALYSMSDVLLCVSREEGFGLCVLEAMAAGAAVIAPGRPPFTEYLTSKCARLVDTDSNDDVSGALARMADHPRERDALRRVARSRTLRFTWARSARRHLRAYEAVASSGAIAGDPASGVAHA